MIHWLAAAGALLVSLDSMMNIAFPALAATFAVPPERAPPPIGSATSLCSGSASRAAPSLT